MRKTRILVAAALAVTSACLAMYSVSNKGRWPEAWPWPLEGLRGDARSYEHDAEVIHEIPFADREQFESKWPFLLSVKTPHAPLKLLKSPDKWLGNAFVAGVRIRSPLTGHLVTPGGTTYRPGAETAIKDGKFLKIGPPWPDYLKSADGELPEYVIIEDGKWKAQDPKKLKHPIFFGLWRARTDIDLIVDGKIVDLNRIPLPAGTPIVDKRFGERK
jgi:hypothetical protein